ncbi:S9 family peptidase [Cytophagaceae bacterium ABcell3]|nr:S9 family peptidase [Cytophagaceae bacterium ABcell3]
MVASVLKRALFVLLLHVIVWSQALAQGSKNISLEELWMTGNFHYQSLSGLRWMAEDPYYTAFSSAGPNQPKDIVQYDIRSGKAVKTLVKGAQLVAENKQISLEEYAFNPTDLTQVLITTNTKSIYRHSTTADYYLFNTESQQLKKLNPAGQGSYATWSPDGKHIAYVRENNLYLVNAKTLEETAITDDGKYNHIINGASDWVYEEEFELVKGFEWSPDGKKIAFYRFDESNVREYVMQLWQTLYPEHQALKYPKAGEKNSDVQIFVYDIAGAEKKKLFGEDEDIYVPRIKWQPNSEDLFVYRMNRYQNHLHIYAVSVNNGEKALVYEEQNDAYIEINNDLTFVGDNKSFIISSEKDGYKHLYQYSLKGKELKQITKGKWEVDDFYGMDQQNTLYFTSTEVSSMERHLYSIRLDGKKKKQLTKDAGTYSANFSNSYKYYILTQTSISKAPSSTVYATNEKFSRKIMDNQSLEQRLKAYDMGNFEFKTFPAADGTELNGFMITPSDFDADKEYPVLMTVYGGPGHQQVMNRWGGHNHFWYHMLAQKGYIVVCIDGRGTGGRGEAFKKSTQHNLGKYETEDVIATAKHLAALSYIDSDRIGIFGWSFGGYLSSLAITLGAEHFKMAIAVAPVTSWRFYDTIYTERFLGLPSENAAGYDQNSPITHAGLLKGKYLLIHGTADDNVHIQNALEMQNALIAAGKQFDTFYYPNRNHGIYGGNTRLHLYEMMTNYIINNL